MRNLGLYLALAGAAGGLPGPPAGAHDQACPSYGSGRYYPDALPNRCPPETASFACPPFRIRCYLAAAARCYAVATPPPGRVAKPIQVVEIGVYDNYFGPQTVTISPGTQVRWVNNGRHRHTTTSNTGVWDSGEFGPGGSYTVISLRPGTYYYYCRVHPREMRATVIVR
jgi:plastocyanin